MISHIIAFSIKQRLLIVLAALMLGIMGLQSLKTLPIDALPDLSDVQVIIKTSYSGQAPEVVENQITYPITSMMMSVPKAKVVRGYSFFGDSYVYVIFEDGTDIYWARSRILEYLNQASNQLPVGVEPQLGPDASGIGWIYNYALVDNTESQSLANLRSIQDNFLKYELQAIEGVAEIAPIGGMVQQYQIEVNPLKLQAYQVSLNEVKAAIENTNNEVGGSVIELAEAEYMVRSRGYAQSIDDFKHTVIKAQNGKPVLIKDVAKVSLGPQMRRGIAELNGDGEVVGAIVVLRHHENANSTIERIKHKINQLKHSLPEGVEIIETYNRATLIQNTINNLKHKLLLEMLVVMIVCALFLLHFSSSLVAAIFLPLGVLGAFLVMRFQGINADMMSLGGIAISIGTMVDAVIVMIENHHKHLECYLARHQKPPRGNAHWKLVQQASTEVGGVLFISLLIITVSFLPILALEAQEGRLFSPLAYTKTYVMAIAAGLSITLVPVLMGGFIRGRIKAEDKNPLNRLMIALYRPVINAVLKFPIFTLLLALLVFFSIAVPLKNLGQEFLPKIDEGDLMYMPTTFPGLSIGEAQRLLQHTDKLIMSIPEVQQVFGKIGRAETATDPAPLTMIETVIQLKEKSKWRTGMTLDDIIKALDTTIQLPGVTNAWVMPIKTRIDMLSTGIKTPIGIKITGADLSVIEDIGKDIEKIANRLEGTQSAFAERTSLGRYIEITPKRIAMARLGVNVAELNKIIAFAIGGKNIGQVVDGVARYPINLRYPQDNRDSLTALQNLPIQTESGAQVTLEQIADIHFNEGAPIIKTENTYRTGWVFIDINQSNIQGYIESLQQALNDTLSLPNQYSISITGQYEYLQRAKERLWQVIPIVLMLIFMLLYLAFSRLFPALVIMLTLPFALLGAVWLVYLFGYQLSVAVTIGLIATAGVAAEFGVVMFLYLDQAFKQHQPTTKTALKTTIIEGAVKRVRPKIMTIAVIVSGLLPIVLLEGTGSEVMARIATPMLGGMLSAPLLSMILIPAIYLLWYQRQLLSQKAFLL